MAYPNGYRESEMVRLGYNDIRTSLPTNPWLGAVRMSVSRNMPRASITQPTNHERLRYESVVMQMSKVMLPSSLGIVNEDHETK
jgi:hypothetical protein